MIRLALLFFTLTTACRGTPAKIETGDDTQGDTGDSNTVVITDSDGDGFDDTEDCDDTNAAIYPGAEEQCNGIDDDCDGELDEDPVDGTTWYPDGDSDGYGVDGTGTVSCTAPEGHTDQSGDCDDGDPEWHPGALEDDCADPNDYNCDGSVGFADADSDGSPACLDCDDTNASARPGSPEVCDGVDNDCDGTADGATALDASTWYADGDTDGYGDTNTSVDACTAPIGHVADDTDCDDTSSAVNPGATEVCDGVDNNCDGSSDGPDSADATTWYADSDGDGAGGFSFHTVACSQPPGYVSNSDDCDDNEPLAWTGATEACDGVDNDCDGTADGPSAVDASTWYADTDGDGYGDPAATATDCSAPSGYVADSNDCNDSEPLAWSGATEVCDSADNDCDGTTDGAGAADAGTWYQDTDADGYGDSTSPVTDCTQPASTTADATDCNDANADIHPGAAELCDTTDWDCDGDTRDPESSDSNTWYADSDADGFGDATSTTVACDVPSGHTSDDTDCHDNDATAYPGSHEIETPGDGIDTDCDGDDTCRDLNCDGWPDVVFGNYYDGTGYNLDSTIYYGSATGFSATNSAPLPTLGSYGRPEAADLDGDGYIDLVLPNYYSASYQQDSYIYWGSAAGHSSADRTGLFTYGTLGACLEDFDNDGDTDVLFSSYRQASGYPGFSTESTLFWNDNGTFTNANSTALENEGARMCVTADLNNDGWIDIVLPSYINDDSSDKNNTTSSIYWGSSAGYSTGSRTQLTGGRAPRAKVADVNTDGFLDILLVRYRDATTYAVSSDIYWGSTGTYSNSNKTQLEGHGNWDAAIADLDGDGRTDIALSSNYGGSGVVPSPYGHVYYGSQVGYTSGNRISLENYGGRDISARDLDGDGQAELIVSNRAFSGTFEGDSYIYWGSTAGYSNTNRTGLPTQDSRRHDIGDLDGDGWPEIVFANYQSDASQTTNSVIYWGSATGYSATNSTDLPTVGGASVRIVGAYDE